jgi:hypothetical protein
MKTDEKNHVLFGTIFHFTQIVFIFVRKNENETEMRWYIATGTKMV